MSKKTEILIAKLLADITEKNNKTKENIKIKLEKKKG